MALPTPDLDDRRFQDLVDDAKRLVQQRCPEWTDHNVSDPGVTLIETFAYMVDQLLYRLNRVPDRLYVKFLELIGTTLFAPTSAIAEVTFWLSAPQELDVRVAARTEVATPRTEAEEAVTFETTRELTIPPRTLRQVATQPHDGELFARPDALIGGESFGCFSPHPVPGDVLLLGLDEAAPHCVLAFRFDCSVQGVGVDPLFPPLAWEAWDGAKWLACDVDRDETGGLNRPGDVVVYVPGTHVTSLIDGRRAGWLRCRVTEPEPGFPFYGASPTVRTVSAATIGGTVPALHAETIQDEIVGISEGVPGQVFRLAHTPIVVGDGAFTVEVAAGHGWDEWTETSSFAQSGADDHVLRLDRSTGELRFGPAVREQDGSYTHYGAVPPKAAPIRVRSYRTGGGPAGNVSARAISVLRSPIPFVERVENRRPATGGIAGETIEQAKVRGPLLLRTRDRAVTPGDYEYLAREAAPDVARVRCVPAGDGADAGGVRLLVVPAAAHDAAGRLRFEDLVPSDDVLERITQYLDERRAVGARLLVEPPFYQGVTVVAQLTARPRARVEDVRAAALAALYHYIDPLTGGMDAHGWSFGRAVRSGEVYSVLQRLPGVEVVDDVRLFAADPITGQRGEPVQRIPLDSHALAFSFEHQVRVSAGV
jgi:predicted phage baseplate assembly protein